MLPDGKYGWRGEWLHSFPQFTQLDDSDSAAWEAWIKRPETDRFLDDTIEECKKLAKSRENARGYAVIEGDGNQKPDSKGYTMGNLRIPEDTSHKIEMHEVSKEFAQCWKAAGSHIQAQARGLNLGWLKSQLVPPFLEHISFRLGNQLFFIRIEDVDGIIQVPGNRSGALSIAEGCAGHPCIMKMEFRGDA